MAIGDVTFVKGQGGLGRPLPGEDFISGLTLYYASGKLPSGIVSGQAYTLFQASDAQTKLNILPSYNAGNLYADANFADATAAQGEITFSTAPSAAGDVVTITANVLGTGGAITRLTLCTYTTISGDTTDPLLAPHVTTASNANTFTTGVSATSV